jgi:hypothetical protein
MRFLFTITPDEGKPYVVTCDSRDVLKWEDAKPGRKAADLISGNYGMRDFYGLSYAAARRLGKFEGTEREFIAATVVQAGDQLAEGDAEAGDEDDADPTRPAR